MEDLKKWAWIVSARDVETKAQRFLSTSSEKPTFILLEILRKDILTIRTLKLLLIYSWDQILRKSRPNLDTMSEVEIDAVIPWSEVTQYHLSYARSSHRHFGMEETTFSTLLSRLLYQSRRIWPAAMVSISHMVAPFIHSLLDSNSDEPTKLDNRMHHRLCKLHNRMLHLLALPASTNPLKSMVHNWQAQRVLLEITAQFEPPLILDRDSYRAVAMVLAASKKSERESRAATLRTRSWPPWRVAQDGMDAQRLPEDDLSRVVAAVTRMKEAGYPEDRLDRAIRVLGGQEPDGTPTISTRKLLKPRRKRSADGLQHDREEQVWAARIESTRDVQEAWAAFTRYQEQGRQPSLSVYFAMFAKLHYENARSSRTSQHNPSPGDGKEVLPPANDNFSKFYRLHLQSPTVDDLYLQMINAGLRPSGRFLDFLIQRARTPDEGLRVLRDSRMDSQAVSFLGGSKSISPAVLKHVPASTFAAFIALLCRFAPRIIPSTGSSTGLDEGSEADGVEKSTQSPRLDTKKWRIIQLTRHSRGPRLNPLLHCAELLKKSKTLFRPSWYSLFSALARSGVIIDLNLAGDPMNDILAWKVLVAALDDFHRCGLELDPFGFRILCNGLEKAILASFQVVEEEREEILGKSQMRIVVEEFMKLTEVNDTSHPIPRLLHSIEGAHLHAYARVLGLNNDYDNMMSVLQWMVKHHDELNEIAMQSRNGLKLLRRTIVAMKVFLSETEHETEAEKLVNSVELWDGWPEDFETQQYTDRWSGTLD